MGVQDVDRTRLIEAVAKDLKKEKDMTMPEWAKFVKTGAGKERVPDNLDWWYIRAASILLKTYFSPIGVSRLRRKYGNRKNRGYKPEKFYPASGNIIRKILQSLEKAGYVTKTDKGRVISPKGRAYLDKKAKDLKG